MNLFKTRSIFLKLSFFITLVSASTAHSETIAPSLLDKTVILEGFGSIRYRAPVARNDEFPILLVHGVYGGASHRTFRSLLPLLDSAGQRVFIVDLPGVGESDKPKKPYQIEDIDNFIESFIQNVIKERTTVVSESLSTLSSLKVSAKRPDLVRRQILLNPTGLNSLNAPPSEREQQLYNRLYNDENASTQFYQNLLVDNSLKYFLRFGFYNDNLIDDSVLNDYRVLRTNTDQKYLTISFVGGQLYRPFVDAAENVFIPTLLVFGAEYENFNDNKAATAEDFKKVRSDFEYLEIPGSGSIVQREKPQETADAIIKFVVKD